MSKRGEGRFKVQVDQYLPSFLLQRLKGRRGLQNIIANTGWLFFDRFLRLVGGLFIGVWVARYLKPAQYGLLSYSGAFVALFSAIASLGLDGIVIRDIVKEPEYKEVILGSAFILKLCGGLAAFILTMTAILVLRPNDHLMHWLVGITSLGTIFQAVDVIDLSFQSQVRSKYTVYAKNSAYIASSLIKIVLIVIKAPLIYFAWVATIEIVMGSLGLLLAYRISGGLVSSWRRSYEVGKKLILDSWPLIFSGIVIMVYMRIDQIMIGEIVGPSEVGVYSVAVRLSELWYFIPMAIVSSTFPSLVSVLHENQTLFFERLQKLYNAMSLFGYIIAIPVTFFSVPLVEILFGVSYSKAGPMLAVLIWAGLFVNLGVARSSFLISMNWTRVHFLTVFLGSIVNVLLNIVLIPRYGGMGAAIATCVAYWFAAHGSCFLYKPMFRTGVMLTKSIIYPKIW